MNDNGFIHIRSSKFPILPGEAEQLVNEGTYGKALADYLRHKLSEFGYDAPFVCPEDWGWWVELKGQPFAIGICVYGVPLDDNALDLCFQISAKPGRRWSWRQFRFVDASGFIAELNRDLRSIIDSDTDIELLAYCEDFPLT